MTPDNHQLAALFMYFTGVLLCFVRFPQGDRWHRVLGIVAVALWCGVWAIEPQSRTPIFATTAVVWLGIAHFRAFRRHEHHAGSDGATQ